MNRKPRIGNAPDVGRPTGNKDSIFHITENSPAYVQVNRTIKILEQLALGKTLTLKEGYRLGMADDLSVGFVFTNQAGVDSVSSLGALDFKQLNNILNKEEIGFPLPTSERRK